MHKSFDRYCMCMCGASRVVRALLKILYESICFGVVSSGPHRCAATYTQYNAIRIETQKSIFNE